MTDAVLGQDKLVAEWVAKAIGEPIYEPYVAIGFVKNKKLVGGCVFNGYNGFNIEMTCAFEPGIISRRVLDITFNYVFEQLKCLRLTVRTKRSNKKVCRIAQRIGFDYEATLKNYFGPSKRDDAILFRLTREFASRWMR